MSVAANAFLYQEPGKLPSAVLAVLVHVLLAVFLFFGVHWQSKQPEAVTVELWDSLPAPVAEKVEPKPEIKPEPIPDPKPEVKPAPQVEAPKPDIALEKKKEPKKEPPKKEPPKKELAKKELPKLKPDRNKEMLAQAERETVALERSRNLDKMKREIVPGTSKAKDAWIAGIVGKIKPNVVAQPNIPGNPEAIFDVTLLPTGEVLAVRLRKSSGFKSYDEALERAILKSSPLPKPDRPELFERSLELKFRPLD
jgi:colicin import membrane protein